MHDRDNDFVKSVEAELQSARKKFPNSVCSTITLMEEVGEIAEAVLKHAAGIWPITRVWEEAVQVAVIAQRITTEGDLSVKISAYKE